MGFSALVMKKTKINLALISPNYNRYSETFIQAHRNIPGVYVSYYYDGALPANLEGYGRLIGRKPMQKVMMLLISRLLHGGLTLREYSLARSLRLEGIKCVLAEYGGTGVAVLPVCKKLDIPLIVHFHGYDASIYDTLEKHRDGYIQLFVYAAYIVVVSQAMKQKMLSLGCPEEKIIYNVYGPDDSFFKVSPDYREKILIGAGRFVDKKAPYYTILAFSKIVNRHPDAKLIIAGTGVLHNSCHNLVKYLGMGKQIVLPGAVSPSDLKEYFKNARAVVQHSITAANGDMEGTPVVVLEAGAAALSVISTRHAGITDVVIEGETGLLSDEHDVEGMAENMDIILKDRGVALKMGQNARNHIRTNYSMQRHLQKLSDIIKQSVKH
ncbi:MAG: hypothetical protein A2132_05320 [Nitrospirae bacterium RBG_16_43_11]|nr:MAG: hypothetical protein A2132_05320 [Nitrospirae bacterium RBG_16_43_11]